MSDAPAAVTINWLDSIKLVVPVASALALIWVKHAHDKRAERRAAEACLFRGLVTTTEMVGALSYLESLIARAQNGMPIAFHLDLPAVLMDAAQKLSTLDKRNSFLYTDFLGQVEVMRSYVLGLKSLLSTYSLSSEPPNARLLQAITWQARSLEAALVECFQREFNILSALGSRRSIGVTTAVITATEADLAAARETLQQNMAMSAV